MHVHTRTTLSPEAVKARFNEVSTPAVATPTSAQQLIYAGERTPPKFFLAGAPVIPPAAAEVSVTTHPGGADVVLRLMWGPLPAPFPRALAGVGGLFGMLILLFSDRSAAATLLSLLLLLLPIAALLYQQKGERELQSRLGDMLDGATFTPKPH